MLIFEGVRKLFGKPEKRFEFEDYPIKTWKNPNAGEPKVAFGAKIDGWVTMVGHGETPERAIEALKVRFNQYKGYNKKLPEPHTHVPLKFAPSDKISKYETIAIDYFLKVLDMDYKNGFYSDGSSLANFGLMNEDQNDRAKRAIIEKTQALYGIDITDLYDGPLYLVFERIKESKVL
ncbi:hypothetical protein [Dehalogenimonas etheniformans]|uniref:Uncharacterized protein n=1 Tax=Dehalogenimonas etheniformans TaxID=1536648 RepID=A0A2P5P7V6_9CHLR|nr:hypothetical protein [Dehalogenimonas etheniformans]PPD58377.1 hypothetical protein JP09_004530 [Dehalogenimonas etheniformans]QNT76952.1 hypothetical protein HX448_09830 [Dehalogenimonas etheniformans]